MQNAKLIVGLGNPGKQYEYTRHNMGFLIVRELAGKYGASLQAKPQFFGEFAKINHEGQSLLFLLPMTYMNLSGRSVQRCVDFFKISVDNIMVVVDDVYLSFGKMRLREKGQTGGHNGLQNIDEHLKTDHYTRLRVGIGQSEFENLSNYVVGKFNKDELEKLPDVTRKALSVIEAWTTMGVKAALEILSKTLSGKTSKKEDKSDGKNKKLIKE